MATARIDLYRATHKGIRHLLFTTAQEVGGADFQHEPERHAAVAGVAHAVGILREQTEYEEEIFHSTFRPRVPEPVKMVEAQHAVLEELIDEVCRRVELAAALDGEDAVGPGGKVFFAFSRLVGEYLRHLHTEESILMPAVWEMFTDAELSQTRDRLVRRMGAENLGRWTRMMAAAFNVNELVVNVTSFRQALPTARFEVIVSELERHAAPDRWRVAKQRLGL